MVTAEFIHRMRLPKPHTYAHIVGKMTQNLDMDIFKLIFSDADVMFKAVGGVLYVRDVADGVYKDLRVGEIATYKSIGMLLDGSTIRTAWGNTSYYYLRAYQDGWVEVAQIGNNTGAIDILRGGDFTFLAGKEFKSDVTIVDDRKLAWSDVNLYRSAVNSLKTDDSLIVARNLYVGNVDYNFTVIMEQAKIAFGDRSSVWDVNLYRGGANELKTDDVFNAIGYKVGASVGADGSFTTVDGKTVTVTKGLITSIV